MHMIHSVKMSLCISNVCILVLRSETEPLVLQFIYVFHDHDMRCLYCGIDMCFTFLIYVLLLLQLLILAVALCIHTCTHAHTGTRAHARTLRHTK